MVPQELIDRLGQIAKTLEDLASKIDNKKEPFIDLNVEPDDIKQAQYLIEDLRAFNALQNDHLGSFINLDKARAINEHYNKKFLRPNVSSRLPLMITQMWFVDAARLKILTDFITNNKKSAKTIRIYPGIVTKAEDSSMADGEERFTLIFTAIDEFNRPITGNDLDPDIVRRIDAIHTSLGMPKNSTATTYDVLEEIGTCKPPQSCAAL